MSKKTPKYSSLKPTPSPAHISATAKDIFLALAISVLPLLAFTSILIFMITHFRLHDISFADKTQADAYAHKPVIYINLSATLFTTVSSWSSTVAPLSIPFILTIASYPAARMLFQASDGDEVYKLPTPYQIALVLRVMSNSSLSSLWQCIVYASSRKKRAPRSPVLNMMMCILILGTIQSMLIFATDTWLHATTETVLITRFHDTTLDSGFGLPPICTEMADAFQDCPVGAKEPTSFRNRSEVIVKILANNSETVVVHSHANDTQQYAYIAAPPNGLSDNVDYRAGSFAVKTNCTPATSRCLNSDSVRGSIRYQCDFAMEGKITLDEGTSSLKTTYFTDSTLSNNSMPGFTMSNPYYFGAAVGVSGWIGWPSYSDDEIFSGYYRPTAVVLLCESTVFDVEYRLANGSIDSFDVWKSNISTASAIGWTQMKNGFAEAFIMQQTISDLFASNATQQLADRFAHTYSQATVATAGGVVETRPAYEARRRYSTLVAAVPVAPLVSLLVANLLVVILAIVLTVGALVEVAACGEVEDVQARLSIDALVAAHFEPSGSQAAVKKTEDMFQERRGNPGPLVKVQKTAESGWELASYDPSLRTQSLDSPVM